MKHFCNFFVLMAVVSLSAMEVNGILKPLKLFGKLILKEELKGGSGGGLFIGIQCTNGCNRYISTGDVQFGANGNNVAPQGGSWAQSSVPSSFPSSFNRPYQQPSSGSFGNSVSSYTQSNNQYRNNGGSYTRTVATSVQSSGYNSCGNGCFYDQSIRGCNCNYRSVLSRS